MMLSMSNADVKLNGDATSNFPSAESMDVKPPVMNGNGATPPQATPTDNTNNTNKNNNNDLSSDDIDVTTTPKDEPGTGRDSLLQMRPEPDLPQRLKRVKSHILAPLFKHSKSTPFREPVDAKALGIYPVYHQIVKRPMDLGTVRKKIDRVAYSSRRECLADIQQVWENAKLFNAPGHFVYQAADILEKVTKDKLEKLERDEEAGVFDLPKRPKLDISVSNRLDPRPERRAVRKISQDLPGESLQPQQLKKKYVENLTEQLKQCDAILKELLTVNVHQSYVEPFLKTSGKYRMPVTDPMDLYKVQHRLQTEYYQHPVQFANDIRQIVTEVYRYNEPEDEITAKASDLQHKFELLFAKVVYDHVDPVWLNGTNEDDLLIGQYMSVHNKVRSIQSSMNVLIRDLHLMRRAERAANGPKRKRGRPQQQSQQKQPKQASPSKKAKHTLSSDESLALRTEVASLKEEQQQKIVQIMMDNGERLTTDSNGYTEIDFGNCSAGTIKQIQVYVKTCKKKNQTEDSEESSDDSSDDEDSSSSSSSDEDSD